MLQQRLDVSRRREYVQDQHIGVFGDAIARQLLALGVNPAERRKALRRISAERV